ncbi:hypothetical protein CJP46_02585 [Paenibacillus sp. XY044]|nr:hypothetical protein CJP46_02585 [Paenibacillus sp. XY044]
MEKDSKNDKLYIMKYTLSSGIRGTVPLSTNSINDWLECYNLNKVFITKIGTEYFGLDPKYVADFKVHNEQHDSFKNDSKHFDSLSEAYNIEKIIIKVDCKCNTIYNTELSYYTSKWYCSKCKESVYHDKNYSETKSDKRTILYFTNKHQSEHVCSLNEL